MFNVSLNSQNISELLFANMCKLTYKTVQGKGRQSYNILTFKLIRAARIGLRVLHASCTSKQGNVTCMLPIENDRGLQTLETVFIAGSIYIGKDAQSMEQYLTLWTFTCFSV